MYISLFVLSCIQTAAENVQVLLGDAIKLTLVLEIKPPSSVQTNIFKTIQDNRLFVVVPVQLATPGNVAYLEVGALLFFYLSLLPLIPSSKLSVFSIEFRYSKLT